MGILSGLWNLVKKGFGVLLSIFPGPRQVAKLRPAVPAIIFITVLIILGVLNYVLNLDRIVQAPFPILRKLWLPILFLLIWILCWLGWWLLKMLRADEEGTLFPDIEMTWNEGLAMLKEQGLDITESPLFLIIGRPPQDDAFIFEALNYHLMVNQSLKNPRSPIQFFANRNGIFITCPSACLLSREAELLSENAAKLSGQSVTNPAATRVRPPVSDLPSELSELLGVGTPSKPEVAAEAGTTPAATATAPGTSPEGTLSKKRSTRKQTHLLFQQQQVEQISARLQYVCRLIARARAPYCPVNGILLMIPMGATGDDDDARQCGAVCRRDLTTIRESLQVRSPFFAVINGLEDLPGFKDFAQRLPTELTRQRLGQDFPLMPDLEPEGERKMIESAVHWVCRGLITRAIYRLFHLPTNDGSVAATNQANANLFEFMHAIREREKRISLIVSRAAMLESPALFGGCYLAAISLNPEIPSAFIGGCFGQLLENQNYVSWTPQALREEGEIQRITRYGYGVTCVLILIAILLGVVYWPQL